MKIIMCVVGIALSWILMFKANGLIFSHFEQSHFISWLFLPAGLRLVATLLFGKVAMIGLFVGAFISGLSLNASFIPTITLSLISAINPYISINLTKRFLNIDDLLTDLSAKHLLVLSLTSALFNGLCHNIYFYIIKMTVTPLTDSFAMFVGDLSSSLVLLGFFSLCIKLIRKSVSTENTA